MAYLRKTWVAREGLGLNRYRVGDLGTFAIVSTPTEITVEGDKLSAESLNSFEGRIESAFIEQNELIGSNAEAISNLSQVVDNISTFMSDSQSIALDDEVPSKTFVIFDSARGRGLKVGGLGYVQLNIESTGSLDIQKALDIQFDSVGRYLVILEKVHIGENVSFEVDRDDTEVFLTVAGGLSFSHFTFSENGSMAKYSLIAVRMS